MTADDFYRTMIEKLDREPFQPFVVEMNDGSRVQIDEADSVAIRGGLAICTTKEALFVRVDNADVRQIVDVPADQNAAQRV